PFPTQRIVCPGSSKGERRSVPRISISEQESHAPTYFPCLRGQGAVGGCCPYEHRGFRPAVRRRTRRWPRRGRTLLVRSPDRDDEGAGRPAVRVVAGGI